MARKKNSVALFEVISSNRERREQAGMHVPDWMHPEQADDANRPAAQPPRERNTPPPLSKPVPKPRSSETPAASTTVRQGGDGWTIAVSRLGAGIAAGCLLLILGLAFLAGRYSAPGPAGSVEAQMGSGPRNEAAKPGAPQGGKKADPAEYGYDDAQYSDRGYLVIQDLQGGVDARGNVTDRRLYAEALDIVDWLRREKKVFANVRQRNGSLIVWSLKGFEPDAEKKDKDQYAGMIEEYGREYMKSKPERRWDFRQRNRRGQFVPRWLPGNVERNP